MLTPRINLISRLKIVGALLFLVCMSVSCISTKYDQDLSDQLAQVFEVGTPESEIFNLLDKIERKTISSMPAPGPLIDMKVECYQVSFVKIYINRGEDRLFCIGEEGSLVWVEFTLSSE